jgi:hypothetical protein
MNTIAQPRNSPFARRQSGLRHAGMDRVGIGHALVDNCSLPGSVRCHRSARKDGRRTGLCHYSKRAAHRIVRSRRSACERSTSAPTLLCPMVFRSFLPHVSMAVLSENELQASICFKRCAVLQPKTTFTFSCWEAAPTPQI